MAPTRKRGFLPLFLILSVSSLFLFTLYRSFSSSSVGISSSDSSIASSLSLNSLNNNSNSLTPPTNPNTSSSFTFTIKVLAYNRIASVSRCLISLANADYGQDRVNLHVLIDHFQNTKIYNVSVDEKLKQSREILDFVDGFSWRFGEKLVHYRTTNVGLQAQWLEAWWPSSDREEFAFVVEDDLEVSPLYYKFLRGLIENYYFNASNFHPSIYGASLQRPSTVHHWDDSDNKLKTTADCGLFEVLYIILCGRTPNLLNCDTLFVVLMSAGPLLEELQSPRRATWWTKNLVDSVRIPIIRLNQGTTITYAIKGDLFC